MNDSRDVTHVDATTLSLLAAGEVDQQIKTAKSYPRNMMRFVNDATSLATIDEDTAGECIYALPRDGKMIVGPSVRFAELVNSTWGNCRSAARIVDEGDRFITAQGVFHDLERNVAISVTVQRRITNSSGKRYSDDMVGVTANAAMSIALRNAILKGVPPQVWKPVYAKVFALIGGTFSTLEKRRQASIGAFEKIGVPEADLLRIIGVERREGIDTEKMVYLRGLLQALRDGDTTVSALVGRTEADRLKAAADSRANLSGKLSAGAAAAKSDEAKNGKNGTQATADEVAEAGKDDAGGAAAEGDASTAQGGASDGARDEGGEDDGAGAVDGQDGDGSGEEVHQDPAADDAGGGVEEGAAAEDAADPGDVDGAADGAGGDDEGGAGQIVHTMAMADGAVARGLPAGEWPHAAIVRFEDLHKALKAATNMIALGRVEAAELPKFETFGEAAEQAARQMIADERRARAKAGGAAKKL